MSASTIGFADVRSGDAYDERIRRVSANKSKTAIEKIFSPEFRNRLDAIVTFRPLNASVMEEIVEKFAAAARRSSLPRATSPSRCSTRRGPGWR